MKECSSCGITTQDNLEKNNSYFCQKCFDDNIIINKNSKIMDNLIMINYLIGITLIFSAFLLVQNEVFFELYLYIVIPCLIFYFISKTFQRKLRKINCKLLYRKLSIIYKTDLTTKKKRDIFYKKQKQGELHE